MEEERKAERVDSLGLMLVECSFAYLGWLNARSEVKTLFSG